MLVYFALVYPSPGIALLDGNEEDIQKLAMKARIEAQQKMLEQQKALRERWGIKDDTPGNAVLDRRRQREEEMKQKMNAMLADIGDDVPVLKFGDASVAAPFTSKISSVNSGIHQICITKSSVQYRETRPVNACCHDTNVQDTCSKLSNLGVLDVCHVPRWHQTR